MNSLAPTYGLSHCLCARLATQKRTLLLAREDVVPSVDRFGPDHDPRKSIQRLRRFVHHHARIAQPPRIEQVRRQHLVASLTGLAVQILVGEQPLWAILCLGSSIG